MHARGRKCTLGTSHHHARVDTCSAELTHYSRALRKATSLRLSGLLGQTGHLWRRTLSPCRRIPVLRIALLLLGMELVARQATNICTADHEVLVGLLLTTSLILGQSERVDVLVRREGRVARIVAQIDGLLDRTTVTCTRTYLASLIVIALCVEHIPGVQTILCSSRMPRLSTLLAIRIRLSCQWFDESFPVQDHILSDTARFVQSSVSTGR